MRTHFWTTSALAALMLFGLVSLVAAESRTDSGIERTAEAYRKAVLAGDATAVGATYGRDAVEMPPNCPPLNGRAAIEQHYRELFGGSVKVTEFTFTHRETATAGNIGFTTGAYKQRLMFKSGEAIEDSGRFVVIVKREAGGWKSAYVIYNSDHPPATAGGRAFVSPFPPLMKYYSAVAAQWLFRLALLTLGCAGVGVIVNIRRASGTGTL